MSNREFTYTVEVRAPNGLFEIQVDVRTLGFDDLAEFKSCDGHETIIISMLRREMPEVNWPDVLP